MRQVLSPLAILVSPLLASAADWSFQWTPGAGEAAPTVQVCNFKYGKDWAYTVEIDDGPATVLTNAQPLLAQYKFTDAPPGVSGGTALPFVGGVSVIAAAVNTPNYTNMTWSNLRTLQSQGWAVLNHSYSHIGQSYAPVVNLSAAQVRRELFWSQALFGTELGGTTKRTPTHFVYPNGYMGYQPYLGEFGLQSASRVGGSDPSNGMAYAANATWTDLSRSNLDGTGWTAMSGFPTGSGPAAGQVVIDFTHNIDATGTANQTLWSQRLGTIAGTYGQAGSNNVWSAPSGDIYEYAAARKQASVAAQTGKVTLSLPDSLAATPLTLKLTGVQPDAVLTAPVGGLVYRQGTTAWITTPGVPTPGALMAQLNVERIYSGAMKNVTFGKNVTIAAVRVCQFGGVTSGFKLRLDAQLPAGGSQNLVPAGQDTLADAWGSWLLFDQVPNSTGVVANALNVTTDNALQQMEVWAVVPEPTSLGLLAVGGGMLLARRRR